MLFLLSSTQTKTITEAFLEGNSDKARLGRLARQADELAPIHQSNESLLEVIEVAAANDFNETWTALALLDTTVATVETKVDDVSSDMATGFDGTWTAIDDVTTGWPIKISDADASGDTITLSTAGTYQLCADITKKIVISGNYIDLNLDQYIASRTVSGDNNISISGTYCRVHNGTVTNNSVSSGYGVLVSANNNVVENITAYGCGIGFGCASGVTNNRILSCEATDCYTYGFFLDSTEQILIENCMAQAIGSVGYASDSCSETEFKNCVALKIDADVGTFAAGFQLVDGSNNRVDTCTVQLIEDSKSTSTVTAGIYLQLEEETEVFNCNIRNIQADGSDSVYLSGLLLTPTIIGGASVISEVGLNNTPTNNPNNGHWSPDEKYLLVQDTDSKLYIFSFNGSSLDFICVTTLTGLYPYHARWSPDGRFIATENNSRADLQIYEFTGGSLVSKVTSTDPTEISDLQWSPNGKFIAITEAGSTDEIKVYPVDTDAGYIGSPINIINTSNNPNNLTWSPDGNYLATGAETSPFVTVYSVNQGYLTQVDTDDTTIRVTQIAWAPASPFFAVSDNNADIRVFYFDGSTISFTGAIRNIGRGISDLSWSPDGKYLVVAYNTGGVMEILEFDRKVGGATLSLVDSSRTLGTTGVWVAQWSPSGKYIATGEITNDRIQIWNAMDTCTNCKIDGNTVTNVSTTTTPIATGIGGSTGLAAAFNNNICSGIPCNFLYGVPNTYYGSHNKTKPFDNISLPLFS